MIKLSATRINVFLQCKLRYWFQYHKRMPKMSNPAFKLGIAVHEALEFAGNLWRTKESFDKKDIESILTKFDVVALEQGLEDYGTHEEGRLLVRARANDFMMGKKIIALESRFGFNKDLDVSIRDIPLIGAIDKVEEVDENTIMIIDYKTSKTAPTPDQVQSDKQLSLYDIAARQLWPGYDTVILCLDLLKSRPLYTYRTPEQREAFIDYLVKTHRAMELFKEKNAKASLNTLCPWCDFRNYCDAYRRACEKKHYSFDAATKLEEPELVDEWNHLRSIQKILSARESELSMILTEKIKRNSKSVKSNTEEVYIRQNARTTYDPAAVAAHVPIEDFSKMVNVTKKAIENYVEYHPEIRGNIMAAATTNYTSPFLASKKITVKGV